MQKILFSLMAPILIITASCSNFSRKPSSLEGSVKEDLENQYVKSLAEEIKNSSQDQNKPIIANSQDKIAQNTPEGYMETFSYPHQNLREEFVIKDLENYEIKDVNKIPVFLFDTTNTIKYELAINNEAISNRHKGATNLRGDEFFNAEIECDGDYKIRADQRFNTKAAGEKTNFRIFGKLKTRGPQVTFMSGANVKSCLLRWENPLVSKKTYGVHLVSEGAYVSKEMMGIRSSYQNCVLPQADDKLTSMQKFFLSPNYRQLTCPMEVNKLESLAERVQGFNAKVEILLGQPLSKELIEKQDPYMNLDFSKAPKLDMIIVSYLVYQSDFSGMVLTRLLDWHAKRGTQIRIYVSDVLQGAKSKEMLNKLAYENPSVKVREYRFNAKSKHGTIISQLHRVNHIKILSTVSFTQPELNVSIVGGRNIHDGFLFQVGADHSGNPELIDYHKKGLAYWRDFEVKIKSVQFTREIVGQFYTSWDQDQNTSYVRSWVQNIPSKGIVNANYFGNASKRPMVRHYISTPYVEGRLIQDLFADMIDHAQKKILISTPYFRLSKPLVKAFERAIDRGVDITVITRMNLDGDTLGSFLGETNKAGINKFYNKIKVYNYDEEKVILHSKIVLIDDEFSFLGSVNLNRRSFIHDTENALFAYSPAYNQELTKLYQEDYVKLSVQITEKQKQVFWKKILIDLFSDKF